MTADRHSRRPSPARRGAAHARLTRALATLTDGTVHKPSRATVTELCRLADVSRNSLYRYHAPILAALRRQQRPKFPLAKARHSAEQRRRENLDLHDRLAKLAALADHYFTVYCQTAAILERRERELAELRGKSTSRPFVLHSVPIQDRARS